MDKLEICYTSAGDLSKLVQSKEISPVEIIEAHLSRIDETEPILNSFITLLANGHAPPPAKPKKTFRPGDTKAPCTVFL